MAEPLRCPQGGPSLDLERLAALDRQVRFGTCELPVYWRRRWRCAAGYRDGCNAPAEEEPYAR